MPESELGWVELVESSVFDAVVDMSLHRHWILIPFE